MVQHPWQLQAGKRAEELWPPVEKVRGGQSVIVVVQLKRSEMEKERQGVYVVKYVISKVSGIGQAKAVGFRVSKRGENVFGRVVGLNS